jgi:hypothetical protein
MREYLDLEFKDLAPVLPFAYNLERIIDDFVLLAVFVGNDFLPNLPDLHIHENGLERLFEVYKKVLPGLGVFELSRPIVHYVSDQRSFTSAKTDTSTSVGRSIRNGCSRYWTAWRNGSRRCLRSSM